MRNLVLFWLLGVAGSTGCRALTNPPDSAKAALDRSAERLQAGDHGGAIAMLDHFGDRGLALNDKAHWHLLRATAFFRAGEPADAYDALQSFMKDNHVPTHSHEMADLLYAIGEALALEPDTPWWNPFSHRRKARTALVDFITRYPTHKNVPDALHRLGELDFEDGEYEMGRERFTQIIYGRYDTVWNTKAAFRVAMSYFHRLEGPEYDFEEMDRARAELRDFLATDAENPNFRREAEQALHTVREWLAEKHTGIAHFYLTVGNERGFLYHLERARDEFPETAAGKRAAETLAKRAVATEQAP